MFESQVAKDEIRDGIAVNVEDELRITLPPEAVDLETVGDVVRYLDELIAKPLAGVATGMGLEQPARPSA